MTFPEREVGNGEDRWLREGKRSSGRDESGKSLEQNKPQRRKSSRTGVLPSEIRPKGKEKELKACVCLEGGRRGKDPGRAEEGAGGQSGLPCSRIERETLKGWSVWCKWEYESKLSVLLHLCFPTALKGILKSI